MPRFIKKPIAVEASQFTKTGDHLAVKTDPIGRHYVRGRQGLVEVHLGDWIIREADGSGYYPCAPDVFAAQYEEAA